MKSLIRLAACFACLIAVAALSPAARAQHEEPGHATSGTPTGTAQPDTAHAPDAAHAGDDHAAGGHEASPFPNKNEGLVVGIANLVIFSLVFAVLAAKVWPKINKGLADREAKIKHEIEAAEAARRQAKEALESYERSLAEARNEAKKMLDDVKVQQQAFAAELRTKADAEVTAMKDRARRDIEAAKRAALDEIYTKVADLATDVAGKILHREFSPQDYQRMVDESMAELQESKA